MLLLQHCRDNVLIKQRPRVGALLKDLKRLPDIFANGLLVKPDQPYRRAADLLKAVAAGKVPLISLPPHELLPRLFQKEMVRRNLTWRTAMETSSQDSVSTYVRNGLGAVLRCRRPSCSAIHNCTCCRLAGFPACQSELLARKARRDWPNICRRALGQEVFAKTGNAH